MTEQTLALTPARGDSRAAATGMSSATAATAHVTDTVTPAICRGIQKANFILLAFLRG